MFPPSAIFPGTGRPIRARRCLHNNFVSAASAFGQGVQEHAAQLVVCPQWSVAAPLRREHSTVARDVVLQGAGAELLDEDLHLLHDPPSATDSRGPPDGAQSVLREVLGLEPLLQDELCPVQLVGQGPAVR